MLEIALILRLFWNKQPKSPLLAPGSQDSITREFQLFSRAHEENSARAQLPVQYNERYEPVPVGRLDMS